MGRDGEIPSYKRALMVFPIEGPYRYLKFLGTKEKQRPWCVFLMRSAGCGFMEQAGVNLALDSGTTASYIGGAGGLVLTSGDDLAARSFQCEQDNRYVAQQGYIPVLEPSSPREAKDMMVDAFRLSEEFE